MILKIIVVKMTVKTVNVDVTVECKVANVLVDVIRINVNADVVVECKDVIVLVDVIRMEKDVNVDKIINHVVTPKISRIMDVVKIIILKK